MAKTRVPKSIVFTEKDIDILEHCADKKFSTYVKNLIRRDMEGQDVLNKLGKLADGLTTYVPQPQVIVQPQVATQQITPPTQEATPSPSSLDVAAIQAAAVAEYKEKRKQSSKSVKNILNGVIADRG